MLSRVKIRAYVGNRTRTSAADVRRLRSGRSVQFEAEASEHDDQHDADGQSGEKAGADEIHGARAEARFGALHRDFIRAEERPSRADDVVASPVRVQGTTPSP